MNNTKYSTTANLEATFRLFDKDGSGDISVHELRSILDGSGLEND